MLWSHQMNFAFTKVWKSVKSSRYHYENEQVEIINLKRTPFPMIYGELSISYL